MRTLGEPTMKAFILALILGIFIAPKAYADCEFDGKTYPTGTEIGGLICQPDGTWKRKKQ